MYISLALSTLFLLFQYLISEYVFERLNLYYELPWLDIPMHLVGGFGVAWFSISLYKVLRKSYTLKNILVATLSVAVTWEVFEFTLDVLSVRVWTGWLDTTTDVLNGIIGALVAYKVFSK